MNFEKKSAATKVVQAFALCVSVGCCAVVKPKEYAQGKKNKLLVYMLWALSACFGLLMISACSLSYYFRLMNEGSEIKKDIEVKN